jgi:hypothetical protein
MNKKQQQKYIFWNCWNAMYPLRLILNIYNIFHIYIYYIIKKLVNIQSNSQQNVESPKNMTILHILKKNIRLKCLHIIKWINKVVIHSYCFKLTYIFLLISISVLINWNLSSPPICGGVRVARSLVLCVCFVDRCLLFIHCIRRNQ